MLESFCEGWGVPLESLIRSHTFGQLLLMACASNIRAYELEQELERDTKSQMSKGPLQSSAPTSTTRSRLKPHKPFKEMTSEEYKDYLVRADTPDSDFPSPTR